MIFSRKRRDRLISGAFEVIFDVLVVVVVVDLFVVLVAVLYFVVVLVGLHLVENFLALKVNI